MAGGHLHLLPALPGAEAGVEDGGDRGGAQHQHQEEGEAGGWHGGRCPQTGHHEWAVSHHSEAPPLTAGTGHSAALGGGHRPGNAINSIACE